MKRWPDYVRMRDWYSLLPTSVGQDIGGLVSLERIVDTSGAAVEYFILEVEDDVAELGVARAHDGEVLVDVSVSVAERAGNDF